MFDPVPLLQTLLVGATVAGAVTLSVILTGIVAIAARGGLQHIEDFPRPGVSARAEEVKVRLRHRYMLRQSDVMRHPDVMRQPTERAQPGEPMAPAETAPAPGVAPVPIMARAALVLVPEAEPGPEPAPDAASPDRSRRGRHAILPPLAPSASTAGFTATLSRRQRVAREPSAAAPRTDRERPRKRQPTRKERSTVRA